MGKPLHLIFGSMLRSRSRILDNFFNYQFDMPKNTDNRVAAPDPTLSLHFLTHPDENDHWIAYLADKTRYRPRKIRLKQTYDTTHTLLVFESQGVLMYIDMCAEKIKTMRNAFTVNMDIYFQNTCTDPEWLNRKLKELGLKFGWADKQALGILEPSKREKHAVIFMFAVPQVGFINSIAAFNLTLAVLGTTLLTPYYVYSCHFAVTAARCKKNNGGRVLSPEVRSIIQYDALAMGAQIFVVTGYAAFMMHSTYLEWPSVYESIQAVMGRFKPVIINGIPLDVHLALIISSGIFIGAVSLYITWLRNHDNENFKSQHYGYTIGLGFFIGFSIYAATMMPAVGNFISDEIIAGFAEGAAILLYGALLHKLASASARPALAKILHAQPGTSTNNDTHHGPIEPYINDNATETGPVIELTTLHYKMNQDKKSEQPRPRAVSLPSLKQPWV